MREQTRALATLDQNKVVFVHGPAGTGKTRLALQWARRALHRGDETLITCFNIPLGSFIACQFSETDQVYAGCFEEIVRRLPGLPTPPDAPTDTKLLENYFGLTLPRHILQNIDKVEVRFDTIIVDELQDFHGMWVHVLFALLADGSHSRILTVGDDNQNLYQREGVQAVMACQPSRAQLMTNCRNAQQIGELLHSMGGAEVASASPDGEIFHIEINSLEEAVDAVIHELSSMRDNEVWDLGRVLVATLGNTEKNALHAASTDGLTLVSWENASEGNVLCETVHRTKGLEYDVVILVTANAEAREQLLYVGASRAVSRLVLVSPTQVALRLGI
jgi:superfamily I DNA/RNA helicase